MRRRTYILASGILLAVLIATSALAAGEGRTLLGGKRNPGSNPSQALTAETQIIANTATYGTRQSNKSPNGGGAIYGCRSGAGGTAAQNEPCVRASNLSSGYAFEFASSGVQGGLITVGRGGDTAKPFTTNATGVATGLNADRVDSKSAEDIVKDGVAASNEARPFAQVAADGAQGASRGVIASGGVVRQGAGDYDVAFGGDLSGCAAATSLIGITPGQITVNPSVSADKQRTTVDVRTFDATGVTPTDHGFHLSLDC